MPNYLEAVVREPGVYESLLKPLQDAQILFRTEAAHVAEHDRPVILAPALGAIEQLGVDSALH